MSTGPSHPAALTAKTSIPRWRIALLCAIVAAAAGLLGGVLDRSQPLTFGHDLISSYTAGRLLLDGHGGSLYDAAACEATGRAVMSVANLTGNPHHVRWLNPGFFAPLFVPLAALPYRWAMLVWMTGNAAAFGGAIATIVGWLPTGRRRLLVAGAVVASCPFLLAFQHQQNTFLSLAILTAVIAAWRADRRFLAGLLAGLLAYKPQLAAAVGIALALSLGWPAVAGLGVTGLSLLILGEVAAPGSMLAFMHEVPDAVAVFHDDPTFNWGRQVTPTSFFRALLGAGRTATMLGSMISAIVIASLAWMAWRLRDSHRLKTDATTSDRREHLIVCTILALPLAAPYFLDYDLLLLAIPASIWVARSCTHGRGLPFSARRHGHEYMTVPPLWAALWLTLYLNIEIVRTTGVNGVVVLLAAMLIVSIRKWPRASSLDGAARVAPADESAVPCATSPATL